MARQSEPRSVIRIVFHAAGWTQLPYGHWARKRVAGGQAVCEYRIDVAASDGATTLICSQESGSKGRLSTPSHHLPIDPRPGVVIVQRLRSPIDFSLHLGLSRRCEYVRDCVRDPEPAWAQALKEEVAVRPANWHRQAHNVVLALLLTGPPLSGERQQGHGH